MRLTAANTTMSDNEGGPPMPPAEAHITQSSLADRYRVLLDIGRTLTGTLSAESLYRTIYRETARVIEASGFYIALYDQKQDQATVVFYADQGQEQPVEISYRGSDSEVLRTGRGILIDDGVQKHSLLVLGEEESEITRSAISVALSYEGRVIGAISTQSYSPGAYRERDLELLQGIADIAAVAIVNSRRVGELNQRRLEAERIEEIGRAITASLESTEVLRKVVDAALDILSADASSVWLIDEGRVRIGATGGTMPVPDDLDLEWDFEEAIVRELVHDRTPVLVDDIATSELVPDVLKEVVSAGSAIAVSSRRVRHQVRNDPSGLVRRSTNAPSAQPSDSVSSIACALSILGRCGSWANAPERSFTRRLVG